MSWKDIWGFRDESKEKYIINPKGKKLRGWRKRMEEYNDKVKRKIMLQKELPKVLKEVNYCPNCKENLTSRNSCDLCGWGVNKGKLCISVINGSCYPSNTCYKFCNDYKTKIRKERSRVIPKAVQRDVWRRDMGICIECGSKEGLKFDDIIPFSKGGSNTARNIQLLCEKCNRSKGGNL